MGLDEWLDAEMDRELGAQQARADAAKLVVSFIAALAASLTAGALAQGATSAWDWWAAALTVVAVLLAVLVMSYDRTQAPDVDRIMAVYRTDAESEALRALRVARFTAVSFNADQLDRQRAVVLAQVVVALVASGCAVVSLLLGAA